MKTRLLILLTAVSLSFSVHGKEQPLPKPETNQFFNLSSVSQQIVPIALGYCEKEGFTHFKIKNFHYLDNENNEFSFSAPSKSKEFELYEGKGPSFTYALYCYSRPPEDTDAVNVLELKRFFDLVAEYVNKEQGGKSSEAEASENVLFEPKSEKEFDDLIAKRGKKIYVDLYSARCPPCKILAPKFAKWAEDNAGKALFAKVDISAVPAIGERYSVQSVPTLLIFNEKGVLEAKKMGLPAINNYMLEAF